MSWSGLGINLGDPTANLATDLVYLRSYMSKLRMSMPTFNDSVAVADARQAALDAKAAGFDVMYGVTAGGTTLRQSNWNTFATAVVAEAVWAQANGIPRFSIGNEEEFHSEVYASSLTSSGTTATFVADGAHGYTNGQQAHVYGVDQAPYNGTFTITVTNSTTFTYTMGQTAASPATGARVTSDISEAQTGTKVRALATSVAAVYSGEITYNLPQGGFSDYIANGIGDMDTIGLNNYGQEGDYGDFKNNIDVLKAQFGDAFYLSEWNIDSDWSRVELKDYDLAGELKRRHKYIQSTLTRAYFFVWRYGSEDFSVKYPDNNLRPHVWPMLVSERPWYTGSSNVAISRSATPTRAATPTRSATPNRAEI